jgi:hypothetical protein
LNEGTNQGDKISEEAEQLLWIKGDSGKGKTMIFEMALLDQEVGISKKSMSAIAP